MKRLLAFMLAITMLFAISACGKEEAAPKKEEKPQQEIEVTVPEKEPYEENEPPAKPEPEVKPETENVPDVPSKTEPKPEELPEVKPEPKPENIPAPTPTPETTPVGNGGSDVPSTPEVTPTPEPAPEPEAPAEQPSATVGDALAADFRANSGKSGMEIAEIVIKNSVIPAELSLMTMEVEEGYLTGFDNTEIKGFENGVIFAPAMGTIPFVGYVFTLPQGTDADAFVNTLKDGANLRWNICTSAEQMIVEKSGSKVFFVMCPETFEQ